MNRSRLAPRTQRDLNQIWSFSAARWGEPRAERYLRRLNDVIQRVTDHPNTAQACEDVRPGYRRAFARSHVIVLRPRADHVEIVRILQVAMDFARRL